MSPRKFIEPHTPEPRKHAASILLSGGWEPEEVEWLAPVLLDALAASEEQGAAENFLASRTEFVLRRLVEAKAEFHDTACVLVYAMYFVQHELYDPISPANLQRALRVARDHGVDMFSGLVRIHGRVLSEEPPSVLLQWKNLGPWELGFRLRALGRGLVEAGMAEFADLVRWDHEDDPEDRGSWGLSTRPTAVREASFVDPREPSFWLAAIGNEAVATLVSCAATSADAALIDRAMALIWAITNWMTGPEPIGLGRMGFDFTALPEAVRREIERLYCSVEHRTDENLRGSPLYTPLLLHLARMSFEGRSSHLPQDTRKALLRHASDSLSKMRPLLREAHTAEALTAFKGFPASALRDDAVFLLFELGTLWEAWKPLLLAFRALSAPSLSRELSFHDKAPDPWSIIPSSIVMMFHHRARREQDQDPTLKDMRSEFGQFCLDALKTRKERKERKDVGAKPAEAGAPPLLREPSAGWRFGFIRALLELRINPEGDGHHVLRWVGEHDPDEQVRELAQRAYNEVRSGDCLGDMSPRRAVLQAFWWLEQAHMLALCQDVDGPGAQRTREWMVRMTTEKSSADR